MPRPSIRSAVIRVEKSFDRSARRVKFVVEKPCVAGENGSMAFGSVQSQSMSAIEQINVLERRVGEVSSSRRRSRSRSPVNPSERRQQTLSERVEELSHRLDEVLRNRSRELERRHGRSTMKPKRRWICWFHYRHGVQAQKCEKQKGGNPDVPCIFFGEKNEVYARPQQN